MYSAVRTLEGYKRGAEQRSTSEIMADKLRWTFQTEKIGDLVTKGADFPLLCRITCNNEEFSYSFGKGAIKQLSSLEKNVKELTSNSIFLPAKEVLSLHRIILRSHEVNNEFGFDDTYLDLARALRQAPTQGNNYNAFVKSRKNLEAILGGAVEYDDASSGWRFVKGRHKFPIAVTAEGVKKIAILDTLLGNRYLTPSSTIFIDEPESALHPTAISQLLDIVAMLAELGIQFFLASHSYFVVKKLYLLAQEKNFAIPVLSASNDGWRADCLSNGMPDNPIIDESIRLYKEEVGLSLK